MKIKLNCILIIDDDKLVNSLNKILIQNQNANHNTIKKASAMAGLYYLTKSADIKNPFPFPQLILLDIDIPEVKGRDFMVYYEKIKNYLPSQPIIYMLTSGVLGRYSQANGFADVQGIYQKPLTQEIFSSICEEHFICS